MTEDPRSVESRALRMLNAGDRPKEVSMATGLTLAEIARLRRDFPSSTTRPAPPVPVTTIAPGPISELPTHVLSEHPANVRAHLEDIDELTSTIRTHGVLQALLVTRGPHGRYVVLDGHRRLAAAIAAGLPRVPVTLHGPTSLDEALELMLVTGLQKVALHPLDEAAAYGRLLDLGHRPADIARAVGKNAGHISQRLALLNLTLDEQAAVRRKDVSIDAAYRAGRDRSTRRRPEDTKRPKPKRVPHFTNDHPLAELVAAQCDHDTLLKLGVGCGPCWEQLIREDERLRVEDQAATGASITEVAG